MTDLPVAPAPAYPRRRLRWAVPPLAAAVLLGGFGLAPSLAGTEAPPDLPPIATQDLVAKMIGSQTIAGFTGTLESQTDLGLPSLGALGPSNTNLLTTLLAPHTAKVWYASGGKLRLAIPDSLSETDVVSDGTQVWVWQSSTQTVDHLAKSPAAGGTPALPTLPALPEDDSPPALASRLLTSADPTTRIFVRGTAAVAGRSAYELVLAPRATDTTVADAVIDVDAATGLPLRVQVIAQSAGSPALEVGFTDLTFNVPAATNFTFTPPPGATVQEVTSPEELLAGPPVGPPGGAGGPLVNNPRRQGMLKGAGGGGNLQVSPGGKALVGGETAPPAPTTATTTKRQVIGSGWDAVLVLPDGPRELAVAGTTVSGPWGTGRLVTSKLVDALILPDGRMLVGLVSADRLEAAVSQIPAAS